MSKLLLDENPLVVLPQLAVKIGLNEAIFLQQMHYWLNRSKNVFNGRTWAYNSYENLQQQFPFFSIRTIKRIVKNLIEKKILIVDNFNKDNRNKTNWYSINYDSFNVLIEGDNEECQSDMMEVTTCHDGECQSGTMESDRLAPCIVKSLTETTAETTAEIKKKKEKKSIKSQILEKVSEHIDNINASALDEWLEYKNYKSIAPVTKTINFLVNFDMNTQQQIVDNSIMNEYKGLFEPKQQQQTKSFNTPTMQTLNTDANVWDMIDNQQQRENQGAINGQS